MFCFDGHVGPLYPFSVFSSYVKTNYLIMRYKLLKMMSEKTSASYENVARVRRLNQED
jgi:hypothetical protein